MSRGRRGMEAYHLPARDFISDIVTLYITTGLHAGVKTG